MARKVHEIMSQRPIVTIALIMERCETTAPMATKALSNLSDLEIVRKIRDKERGRVFAYVENFR